MVPTQAVAAWEPPPRGRALHWQGRVGVRKPRFARWAFGKGSLSPSTAGTSPCCSAASSTFTLLASWVVVRRVCCQVRNVASSLACRLLGCHTLRSGLGRIAQPMFLPLAWFDCHLVPEPGPPMNSMVERPTSLAALCPPPTSCRTTSPRRCLFASALHTACDCC